MKYYTILICTIIYGLSNLLHSQEYESGLLPIGEESKKYELCAVEVDQIIETDSNKESSFEEMIEALMEMRIVMIGETHTNQSHHDIQLEIIKGLVEQGKPVVLALEMYNPSQNTRLAAWSSGETNPDSFMEQTGYLETWGHNYRYYKAIFDYAREKHLPMYGANVDRKYASKIGRGGLESLSDEERDLLPHIDTSNIEHKFLINILMEGMGASLPQYFKNMYPAQCLWDCAMGEGAIKAAEAHPDATVVVLAGSGHVIYNLGIGRVIHDLSNLPFASVVPVDIETKDMDQNSAHGMGGGSLNHVVARSYGDFLWGKQEEAQDKYPSLGISLNDIADNGFPIKSVFPGTIAYEHGLRTGDQVLTINEQSFEDLFAVKKYLQFVNWDQTLKFKIKREDKIKEIECILQPVEE